MKPLSADTPPEIEEILLERYRQMPPFQKLMQVFELNRKLRLRLAALWLDRETMIEAFGWDPEIEGY